MIKVVDSMCGSGKSTAMFKLINEKYVNDLSSKFIYVTPFLSEINDRIPAEMPMLDFKTPLNFGDGKMESLKNLVERGSNIATTHVLFSLLTPEIVDSLVEREYTLVIDEALECIRQESDLKRADIEALLTSGMVTINHSKRGKLHWNEGVYPEHDGKYAEVRNMCNLGVAYAFKDQFLMFEIPPKLLSELPDVYILTYLFKGSDMRCWLEMNGLDYEYLDNDELGLLPESVLKDLVRQNLNILKPRSLLAIKQKNGTLCSGWYKNARKPDIQKFKNVVKSAMVYHKVKVGEVFWTTFKSRQHTMQGNSYTKGVSEDMPAFLPLNTRATNAYRDYRFCIYMCNLFKNPVLVEYINEQGVEVDEETYALSEMIQFVWRGRIRQNEPMDVLILSHRMRELLEEWVNE